MKIKEYIVVRKPEMSGPTFSNELRRLWFEFDRVYPTVGTSPDFTELLSTIEDLVNEKIQQGYQPIGGVSLIDDHQCQAMVKYESN
jgi:hypothetical protein